MMGPGCLIGVVRVMRLVFRSSAFSELVSDAWARLGEVVNHEHDVLAVPSDDVCVEVSMWVTDFCFGFMESS